MEFALDRREHSESGLINDGLPSRPPLIAGSTRHYSVLDCRDVAAMEPTFIGGSTSTAPGGRRAWRIRQWSLPSNGGISRQCAGVCWFSRN
jgi:hypothetical protein